MSGTKKSIDEIWKDLNAAKPKARQGVAGLAVGLSGLPGITSITRTKPSIATAAQASQPSTSATDVDSAASSSGSVDTPHLASTVGEDATSYLATLQRTINCLADPDRGLRRNAATALQTKLFTGDASTPRASPSQLQALLCGPLLRPLVALLSDSVERCRTVALAILLDGGRQVTDVNPMLPELVPELARRFGTLPVQEPAEEVRLQISQLAAMLLAAAPPPQLARAMPDLAAILCRSLEDGFPDIKKVACGAIETAAARVPAAALEAEAEKLVASLAPNLQHQHSRVRLAAIQALDALVAAGAPVALVEGTVASALRPVGHDRAQPVREAAFTALAKWMGYRGDGGKGDGAGAAEGGAEGGEEAAAAGAARATGAAGGGPGPGYVPTLLPLLIIGVTDPQPATAELALRLVEGVGDAWAAGSNAAYADGSSGSGGADEVRSGASKPVDPKSSSADGDPAAIAGTGGQQEASAAAAGAADLPGAPETDEVASRLEACRLGSPYQGRPGPGCRAMVRAMLLQHLPPLARQLGEWTVALRVAAARGLHTTLVMAEDAAAAHLRLLLPALCSAIADDEVEVATQAMACVHVLGAHVSPADWLPRLLDTLSSPARPHQAAASPVQIATTSTSGNGDAAGSGSTGAGSGGPSTSQRTQALVVLSGLLHAAGRARRELPPELLRRLAAVLAEDPMLAAAAEHIGVRQQLLAATINLLAWGRDACRDVALPLHVVLLQLYGSELAAAPPATPSAGAVSGARTSVVSSIVDAMTTLAGYCRASGDSPDGGDLTDGPAYLAALHADWLTAALFSDPESATPPAPPSAGGGAGLAWRGRAGDSTWQCVLRATLLTASPATLGRMAPALVAALRPIVGDKERDPQLRLGLLQLLDGVLEDPQRGPALARAAGQALISEVLLPPLVWQAGKTAAAVRYAALTALATLLGKRLPDPDLLLAAVEGSVSAGAGAGADAAGAAAAAAGGSRRGGGAGGSSGEGEGVLPLLFSALDEDWYTDMRLAACYVVEQLLGLVGPRLSDASRRALYPELHKRLDDAHNSVRVAACGALRAFVEAAGPGYCPTNSGYLVAGVVIHMDDGDPAVQEAACSVLLAAAATKPSVTAAEVRKVRDRFRSKHYCDRVLAACEAALAAADGAPA